MKLLPVLALALMPLAAQAQSLQFDTAPSQAPAAPMPPGINWLQNKPMTLFDLGMMELTDSANRLADTVTGMRGAVAELQSGSNIISIGFYAGLPYNKPMCSDFAKQMRDGLFATRSNPQQLARELSSYFISYGPADPARPTSIGAELVKMMRVTIYMQGGYCEMSLTDDNLAEQVDAASQAAATAQSQKNVDAVLSGTAKDGPK